MSSDATGEIYVLQRGEMTATGGGGTSTSGSGGGTLVTSTSAPTGNIGARSGRNRLDTSGMLAAVAAGALSLVGGAMLVAA